MGRRKGEVLENQGLEDQIVMPGEEGTTEMSVEEAEAQGHPETGCNYKITCCNLINDSFGGVIFENGVAHTEDEFTASWFRNKEGYTVSKGEA